VTIVDADLVVMGTRGHSKLASYFIGTNAERLLQDLPVSVLAVR
jgi:nucleotide-binding universal stress UspA family protein